MMARTVAPMSDAPQPRPLRIGVSACVLGREVRYDGGHKRDRFVTDELGAHCTWVEVCPEVELGLGVPRPTLRLVDGDDGVRMVTTDGATDHTEAMRRFAAERAEALAGLDLDGFILKSRSPSCGMERVKVYGDGPVPRYDGAGLFASALARRLPHLPVEEAGRLHDAGLRERFLTWAHAWRRWRELAGEGFTVRGLMDFHRRYKLVLMARSPARTTALGRLLGEAARGDDPAALAGRYLDGFTEVMRLLPSTGRHVNVLEHAAGYVSDKLTDEDRGELTESIAAYRRGEVPLVVPLTLLKHHVRRLGVDYVLAQQYLSPEPAALGLFNEL